MKQPNFLKGPILSSLLRFAIPVMLALFLQALYGAVDLWAVGTFAASADMAAVSTGSQVMLIITKFITGICMGVTVLLGQRIGEKKPEEAAKVIGGSFWILTFLSVLVTLILIIFAPKLAKIANIPSAAYAQTVKYLRICGAGTVFIVAYNGISGIFRGLGNSTSPLLFVAIACVANIIGDVTLIKVFNMGAAGAAISTVIAQAVSVILSLYFIKRHKFPFPVTKKSFVFDGGTNRKIIQLGLPIALLDMFNETYYFILIGFVNQLGVAASAGVGVAEKLIIFVVLIPLSYMSAISTFVAQNTGAGNHLRAKEAMWKGMCVSVSLGAVMAYILFNHGGTLSLLFNHNPFILHASATFLKATSIECFILSAAYCFMGYFNGLGKTTFVMAQGFAVIFLVKIPYAYYAMHYTKNKLFNIGLSTVWGAVFTFVCCLVYFIYNEKKQTKKSPVN